MSERASSLKKKDEQYFSHGGNIHIWWQELKTMMVNYDLAFQNYCTNVGAKESYDVDNFLFTTLKIQKTLHNSFYRSYIYYSKLVKTCQVFYVTFLKSFALQEVYQKCFT